MALMKWEITFDEATGRIEITGPINNKILAVGVLDLAKDIVRHFTPPAPPPGQSLIHPNGNPKVN